MYPPRITRSLVLAFLALITPAEAQQARNEPSAERDLKIVEYLRAAERQASSFTDQALVASSEIGIARVGCRYSVEEARRAMMSARSRMVTLERTGPENTLFSTTTRTNGYASPTLNDLRLGLLEDAGLCDPLLLQQLRGEKKTDSQQPQALTHSAGVALANGDTENALRLADEVASTGFSSYQQILYYVMFLHNLRQKSAPQADQQFMQLISALTQQQIRDANDVLAVGSYILTSPGSNDTSRTTFTIVNGASTINASVPRPSASAVLADAYLNLAINVLRQPSSDQAVLQSYYTAVYELLPLAAAYNPTFYQTLVTLEQTLAQILPENSISHDDLDRLSGTGSEPLSLAEIDKIPNVDRRSLLLLGAFAAHLKAHKWAAANMIVEHVSSTDAKTQMLDVLNFKQSSFCLESRNLICAATYYSRVHSPLMRTLLLLGTSHLQTLTGSKREATATLQVAVMLIPQIQSNLQPALILSCMQQNRDLSALPMDELLTSYIRAVNQLDTATTHVNGSDLRPVSHFYEQLFVGSISRSIDLTVPGVSVPPLPEALKAVRSTPDEALAIVSRFSDSSRQSAIIPDVLMFIMQLVSPAT